MSVSFLLVMYTDIVFAMFSVMQVSHSISLIMFERESVVYSAINYPMGAAPGAKNRRSARQAITYANRCNA